MAKLYYCIIGFLIIISVQACTERMICPAYQSAFIHDEEALARRFSYFDEDTMPKVLEASKDRYLVIEPTSYKKKVKSLQTIPMEDVYPVEEDSTEFDDDVLWAEREGYDSTAVIAVDTLDAALADSIYVISIKKENFNIDQELYLWYLKDYLVYPDVRLQMETDAAEEQALQQAEKKEKKGVFGFFKNIFKKKNKSDSTEWDVETSATNLDDGNSKKKKKGFNLFKKKNKSNDTGDLKEEDDEPDIQSDPDGDDDDF